MPLFTLLNKFDGETEQRRGSKAFTYKLLSLPKYVILYIKRFTKNNFFLEKNPTIVNFPVKNLELKDCMCRAFQLNSNVWAGQWRSELCSAARPHCPWSCFKSVAMSRLWWRIVRETPSGSSTCPCITQTWREGST